MPQDNNPQQDLTQQPNQDLETMLLKYLKDLEERVSALENAEKGEDTNEPK